jgi:hypothetical protein
MSDGHARWSWRHSDGRHSGGGASVSASAKPDSRAVGAAVGHFRTSCAIAAGGRLCLDSFRARPT